MGWFDGFPFTSKEERERRKKEFEKRIAPFGVDEQREKLKVTLGELFPKIEPTEAMFAYFDAKDAYTKKETSEEGKMVAIMKLRRQKWVNRQNESIIIRLIELESEITSLDEYPTAEDVLDGLFLE